MRIPKLDIPKVVTNVYFLRYADARFMPEYARTEGVAGPRSTSAHDLAAALPGNRALALAVNAHSVRQRVARYHVRSLVSSDSPLALGFLFDGRPTDDKPSE